MCISKNNQQMSFSLRDLLTSSATNMALDAECSDINSNSSQLSNLQDAYAYDNHCASRHYYQPASYEGQNEESYRQRHADIELQDFGNPSSSSALPSSLPAFPSPPTTIAVPKNTSSTTTCRPRPSLAHLSSNIRLLSSTRSLLKDWKLLHKEEECNEYSCQHDDDTCTTSATSTCSIKEEDNASELICVNESEYAHDDEEYREHDTYTTTMHSYSNTAVHRANSRTADEDFFEQDRFAVVDGLITLSSLS